MLLTLDEIVDINQNAELEKERDDWQEAFRRYVADYERVCSERDALKRQRDELLAALRGLVASCDTGDRRPDGRQIGTRMPDRCFVQAGHDAIASVKEK